MASVILRYKEFPSSQSAIFSLRNPTPAALARLQAQFGEQIPQMRARHVHAALTPTRLASPCQGGLWTGLADSDADPRPPQQELVTVASDHQTACALRWSPRPVTVADPAARAAAGRVRLALAAESSRVCAACATRRQSASEASSPAPVALPARGDGVSSK